VPVVALATAATGAYAPFMWARRQRERADVERERAWPSALGQLADALEARSAAEGAGDRSTHIEALR